VQNFDGFLPSYGSIYACKFVKENEQFPAAIIHNQKESIIFEKLSMPKMMMSTTREIGS
jgi:hypothetical protein